LQLLTHLFFLGGAGVYYHFDYVGDPRNYKWINTIQLEKTAEQMQLAYTHGADRIWILNVGDLKPLELPMSHFFDMAYDAEQWGVDAVGDWLSAWATREFGSDFSVDIADILTRYGMVSSSKIHLPFSLTPIWCDPRLLRSG
jgi:hypothetical protein